MGSGRQELGLTPIFLTARQVAESLGISRALVHRLMDQEAIPWVHVGKRRRVPAAAYQAWADQQADAAIARQMHRRELLRQLRTGGNHAGISCN